MDATIKSFLMTKMELESVKDVRQDCALNAWGLRA